MLRLELDSILNQERDIWALKSRINWLVEGEKNTSSFHVSTLMRRKRNGLMPSRIMWVSGCLKKGKSWMSLGKASRTCSLLQRIASLGWIPPFHNGKLAYLKQIVQTWTNPLQMINNNGTSINESFQSSRSEWSPCQVFSTVLVNSGALVNKEVKKVFIAKKIPEYLNKTYLTLIPKIQGSETLGNYRLINLCNTKYTIVSKVIVNRIRPLLGNLISLMQTAFVPERRGTDNAITI